MIRIKSILRCEGCEHSFKELYEVKVAGIRLLDLCYNCFQEWKTYVIEKAIIPGLYHAN